MSFDEFLNSHLIDPHLYTKEKGENYRAELSIIKFSSGNWLFMYVRFSIGQQYVPGPLPSCVLYAQLFV